MKSINVLIVDDEPRIRRGVERLVTSCGEEWEVVAALGDGRKALEFLDNYTGTVDLLITDIRMPEMDGLTLIQEAASKYSFFVIVLTGYDDFEYVQTALREGAADYILKPIDREQFSERLSEMKRKIFGQQLQRYKWKDMLKKEEMLKHTQQTQILSDIISADSDLSHLGYWVEHFPDAHYLLLYISLDSMPVKARAYREKDWKAYFYVLENIIKEVAGDTLGAQGGSGWCWRGHHSEFWTLLGLKSGESFENGRRAAEYTAEWICAAVRTYTPFTVSVSYGEWIEDLYMLPFAKRQALASVQYRLLSGGNQVFRYDTGGSGNGNRPQEDGYLQPFLRRLKQGIEQGNLEEANAVVKQLFQHIEGYASPARITAAAGDLLLLIHATLLETKGEEGTSGYVEESLKVVQEAVNLQELKAEVLRMVRKAVTALDEVRQQGTIKPVEAAKAWIQQNMGSNLTIKRIADTVFMNPTYFCQYFKLQTGETVLDYVTRVRMEQAGRLLRDPLVKLQEVSREVGYQDTRYFSRLFKQHYGQLPSHYRDAHLPPPGAQLKN
ncbi:putative response regulatory protein [compost metagenome]